MKNYSEFENQEIVWTPVGNRSVKNFFKKREDGFHKGTNDELKEQTSRENIIILFEAKVQPDGTQNLLTKESFREMIRFDEYVMEQSIQAPEANETANIEAGEPPTFYKFTDLCVKEKPIDQE